MGRVVRHQLAEAVDLAVGHAEHAADIAQHGARLQLAEGDDLRHPVARRISSLDVADHLVAPVLAEIDVEVRHRDALGIEEALEQQAEAQRVEIGDRQRPGDQRAGPRAAPRPDRDALPLRPLDEIGDDQEVAGEAHLHDHVEFVGEPLLDIGELEPSASRPRRAQRSSRPAAPARAAPLPRSRPCKLGVARQDRLARLRHVGAALGDDESVVAGLGQVGEQTCASRRPT